MSTSNERLAGNESPLTYVTFTSLEVVLIRSIHYATRDSKLSIAICFHVVYFNVSHCGF